MNTDKFELTEELIQKYYDGELDSEENSAVEQALNQDSAAQKQLVHLERMSEMMEALGAQNEPDQLAVRRRWDKISARIGIKPRPLYRRVSYWISIAAAAVFWLFFYGPFEEAQSNELDIESIDCTYCSFMLIQPEKETGHTIIWLNDGQNGECP